jgi:hypothetical protein
MLGQKAPPINGERFIGEIIWSCVVHREVRDEALTGEPAGQP